MTNPTEVEQALREAGKAMTIALADAGVRIVAGAAFGQVLAGLPDAARGMIDSLPVRERYRVFEAASALMEIAVDATPEGKAANEDHANVTEADTLGLLHGRMFAYAVGDNTAGVARALDTVTDTASLYALYQGARRLLAAIDARLPQAGPTDEQAAR
jgi:hypothetical protein